FEHDHRPNLIGRPEVRDVVALDPQRSLDQPKAVGELRQLPGPRAEVGGPPELVPVKGLLGVARDDLHQLSLGAALGYADRDLGAATRTEPTFEHFDPGGKSRHQHPRRHLLPLHVELTYERGDELRAVQLLDLVDNPALAA